jgi:phosphatidylserine decarboxylase
MLRALFDGVFQREGVNFVVTNYIPRRALTRWMGWFAGLEQPLIRDLSLAAFQWFAGDLRLHEARKTRFVSLRDCFTRELKEGARPIDPRPEVIVSPCDAIVGAFGRIDGSTLVQAKGMTYSIDDLTADRPLADRFREGSFVTLRLTSSMYHRFHAPADGHLEWIRYLGGDVWNVNPPALARVPRLFCENERAVVPLTLKGSAEGIVLIPVAAILVGCIQFAFLGDAFDQTYAGPRLIHHRHVFHKGAELGHFRHGSTVIVLATGGLAIRPGLAAGDQVRMGEPLLHYADPSVDMSGTR